MLSALDLAARIDAGSLTPRGAVSLCSAAITARDSTVKAFVQLDLEGAHHHAATATGALRGVPVGVKDIIDTSDMPTEMGSPIYAGWRPKADAPVVSMLKEAGAPVLGKTATTAFAFLDPPATRNPHDPAHSPGGSSSGSAACVAAGMAPLAIGTQTGGSVIRPASYCGVAAIKPSFRLLPTVGVKCFSWALDTVGLFGASVADVAFGLAGLTGRKGLRVDGRAPAAPRIGVVRQPFAGTPATDCEAALVSAARAAEQAGAQVREIVLPEAFAKAYDAHGVIQEFEVRHALAWEWTHHRDALGPHLRKLLEGAQAITPEAYDEARRMAKRGRLAAKAIFADIDVLLAVSAPGIAPLFEEGTGVSNYNRLWTLLGVPCVNVPGLTGSKGLPVGVQVIGPFGQDGTVLEAAAFVERAIASAIG